MPRYSVIRSDRIEYGMWLVFDEEGGVSMTRGQPALGRGQRALSLSATLPRSLFQTPQLSASITVAEPESGAPAIDLHAAESAMRQALGVDVVMSIRAPD